MQVIASKSTTFSINVDESEVELPGWVESVKTNETNPTGKMALEVIDVWKRQSTISGVDVLRLAKKKNANLGITHLRAVKRSGSLCEVGLPLGWKVLFPGTLLTADGRIWIPYLEPSVHEMKTGRYAITQCREDPNYKFFLKGVDLS